MLETIIRNFTLDRLWYIVKKCILVCILFGVIGGAVGGIFAQSRSYTAYRAKVSFYLYSKSDYMVDSNAYVNSSDFNYAKNLINSYILIMKSSNVLQQVIDSLGLDVSAASLARKISASAESGTALFYVYVDDADPYRAMEIANAIADVAPDKILSVVKSGGISVVDYATLPMAPYSTTSVVKYILIGAVGGFGLPFVLFMFIGLLDTTIRKKSELVSAFDIPIMGEIPYINLGKKGVKTKVVSDDSAFAIVEAYNSLCANLMFTTKGEKCPVYAVTSALQDEGKTLTAVNIAKTLARLGKKTLLIDSDLRNATVDRVLSLNDEVGLSQQLAGITEKVNIIKTDNNLDVVVAGQLPPNPGELVASDSFDKLILELKQKYDFIIIDMPPIGIVSDALLINDLIVGYLVVVRAGVTKMTNEKAIIQKFETTESNISGFIVNAVNSKSREYSYMKYSYSGYGAKRKK